MRDDQRRDGSLEVGAEAPDLTLAALDGSGQAQLLDHLDKGPLVLIFGSYT